MQGRRRRASASARRALGLARPAQLQPLSRAGLELERQRRRLWQRRALLTAFCNGPRDAETPAARAETITYSEAEDSAAAASLAEEGARKAPSRPRPLLHLGSRRPHPSYLPAPQPPVAAE